MWHSLEKKEVLEKLKTSEQGLSQSEASKRIAEYGKNQLKKTGGIKPLIIILDQLKSVFILILVAAAIFSLIIQHFLDAFIIMIVVIINSSIGFFQQYKSEKIILKMKKLLVPKVKVVRQGKVIEIISSEIVPGDLLIISEGDRITADCRLIESNDLQMNEAILTGESMPVDKNTEKLLSNQILAERKNMIYAGTMAVRGNGKAIVVDTGMKTEFGKIAETVQKIKTKKTPLEKKLDIFSKKIAVIVLILAALVAVIGIYHGEGIYQMTLVGISLAVSVIPEGLPAVISITLALAIKRMHKYNTLIRKLPAAETLGRTTVICTDKTGTLTKEEMTITEIYSSNKFYTLKENEFYINNKKINPKTERELFQLLRAGVMCNNARIETDNKKTNLFGDPTEKALIISASKLGIAKKDELTKEQRIKEYPFTSKRKMMSIVRKQGNKYINYSKGAPDVILNKCSKELVNNKLSPITTKRRKELLEEYDKMASDALRVLGFAYKELSSKFTQESAENNLIFLGFQGMLDAPRKEVKDAIKQCKDAGIKVKMLTGDSLLTAKAISKMINLKGRAVEGKELEKLSKEEFDKVVKETIIFARITPNIKLKIIQSLKEQKEIVAVTGDGVNDVLALKEAHIGVSMGIRGTDVARDVSDIILLDDNFNTIVRSIREGRRVDDNLRKSIKFHLSANVGELFVVLIATLMSLPLPFLPLAILWMNLITDSLPSLALCVEKEESNIMKRGPTNHNENILHGILKFIIIAGVFSFAVAIGLFLLNYQADLPKARTMALTAAVFSELFIAFACRSDKENIWKIGFFSNKFLIISLSIAATLHLIAIYTPLASIFGLTALSIPTLALTIGLSMTGFLFFEIMKIFKIKV